MIFYYFLFSSLSFLKSIREIIDGLQHLVFTSYHLALDSEL